MENLHNHHDLSLGAVVDRGDRDPDTAESQHAGCQELGFTESVQQISSQENHSGSPLGQAARYPRNPWKAVVVGPLLNMMIVNTGTFLTSDMRDHSPATFKLPEVPHCVV